MVKSAALYYNLLFIRVNPQAAVSMRACGISVLSLSYPYQSRAVLALIISNSSKLLLCRVANVHQRVVLDYFLFSVVFLIS